MLPAPGTGRNDASGGPRGVEAFSLGWPLTLASSKPAFKKELGVPGPLLMPWRRDEPNYIKNRYLTPAGHGPRCHLGDQDITTTTQRFREGQGLAQVTMPGSGRGTPITQLPRCVPMEKHPGDPRQSRVCSLRAGVRAASHKELSYPPLLFEGGVTNGTVHLSLQR